MDDNARPERALSPVERIATDPEEDRPEEGVALCLSGGGYRALLFHLGALWRLNEIGYLPRLERVSSVSGGSIAAGVLGAAWKGLRFDGAGVAERFGELVATPIRRLARTNIDVEAVVLGIASPGTISDRVVEAYREHLFGRATLQDLPATPRFVLNATNLQSGALVRFSRPYLADYRVGRIEEPQIELAVAVAASSAFPPFLSPLVLRLDDARWTTPAGAELTDEGFRRRLILSDGGVYDNLGLETAWKRYRTILVSDGGGQLRAEADVPRAWGRHLVRVLGVIDSQVRALRKRQLIEAYRAGLRVGAYWGIRTEIADYGLPDALPCPDAQTKALAAVPTRLTRLEERLQESLINWGYAACDAALRRHVDAALPAPTGFPHPEAGVG